ncbi:hypothetical protein [uncultured Algibacter sp.]|uniref:hypothetical protein n=1 Tax=uncultured Algibacter sp. TaxID=298659 RepID=UPI0030EDC157
MTLSEKNDLVQQSIMFIETELYLCSWQQLTTNMAIGNNKNRKELTSSLKSLLYAAIWDIFGQVCLHEFIKSAHKGKSDLNNLKTILPEGNLSLNDFIENLNKMSDKAAVETKRNANRALTRNLLKEVFRLTQSYCSETKQLKIMEAKDWYQFTRLVVNSISHDFLWRFNKKDIAHLPIAYKGYTIESKLNGLDISMKLQILIEIVYEIIEFTEKEIK